MQAVYRLQIFSQFVYLPAVREIDELRFFHSPQQVVEIEVTQGR